MKQYYQEKLESVLKNIKIEDKYDEEFDISLIEKEISKNQLENEKIDKIGTYCVLDTDIYENIRTKKKKIKDIKKSNNNNMTIESLSGIQSFIREEDSFYENEKYLNYSHHRFMKEYASMVNINVGDSIIYSKRNKQYGLEDTLLSFEDVTEAQKRVFNTSQAFPKDYSYYSEDNFRNDQRIYKINRDNHEKLKKQYSDEKDLFDDWQYNEKKCKKRKEKIENYKFVNDCEEEFYKNNFNKILEKSNIDEDQARKKKEEDRFIVNSMNAGIAPMQTSFERKGNIFYGSNYGCDPMKHRRKAREKRTNNDETLNSLIKSNIESNSEDQKDGSFKDDSIFDSHDDSNGDKKKKRNIFGLKYRFKEDSKKEKEEEDIKESLEDDQSIRRKEKKEIKKMVKAFKDDASNSIDENSYEKDKKRRNLRKNKIMEKIKKEREEKERFEKIFHEEDNIEVSDVDQEGNKLTYEQVNNKKIRKRKNYKFSDRLVKRNGKYYYLNEEDKEKNKEKIYIWDTENGNSIRNIRPNPDLLIVPGYDDDNQLIEYKKNNNLVDYMEDMQRLIETDNTYFWLPRNIGFERTGRIITGFRYEPPVVIITRSRQEDYIDTEYSEDWNDYSSEIDYLTENGSFDFVEDEEDTSNIIKFITEKDMNIRKDKNPFDKFLNNHNRNQLFNNIRENSEFSSSTDEMFFNGRQYLDRLSRQNRINISSEDEDEKIVFLDSSEEIFDNNPRNTSAEIGTKLCFREGVRVKRRTHTLTKRNYSQSIKKRFSQYKINKELEYKKNKEMEKDNEDIKSEEEDEKVIDPEMEKKKEEENKNKNRKRRVPNRNLNDDDNDDFDFFYN